VRGARRSAPRAWDRVPAAAPCRACRRRAWRARDRSGYGTASGSTARDPGRQANCSPRSVPPSSAIARLRARSSGARMRDRAAFANRRRTPHSRTRRRTRAPRCNDSGGTR
jgi:hypothetical protein